jgi:hypothetical protein
VHPRENGRATVRCGHRRRISREPWSIVDSYIIAASRKFISLSVALLRTITASSVRRQFAIRGVGSRLALSGEGIYQLTGTRRETINRTRRELSDVLLFFGNALVLVVLLDSPLDGVFFVPKLLIGKRNCP